jgi:hypothetical protein
VIRKQRIPAEICGYAHHPGRDYFELERSVCFLNTVMVMVMASGIDAQVYSKRT